VQLLRLRLLAAAAKAPRRRANEEDWQGEGQQAQLSMAAEALCSCCRCVWCHVQLDKAAARFSTVKQGTADRTAVTGGRVQMAKVLCVTCLFP
jgi:hypothetical protein